MQILFTDRVLPNIRRMDRILRKVSLSPYSPKITVAYASFGEFILLSRFCPSLPGLERLR